MVKIILLKLFCNTVGGNSVAALPALMYGQLESFCSELNHTENLNYCYLSINPLMKVVLSKQIKIRFKTNQLCDQ